MRTGEYVKRDWRRKGKECNDAIILFQQILIRKSTK